MPEPDSSPKKLHGGCHKAMPVRKDDQPGTGCRRACLHRASVQSYRDWRHAWEEARENGENMRLEDYEYAAKYPPPTFKHWLTGKGSR